MPTRSRRKLKAYGFLRNRWALSTVVTTLIILVISVLLAGVVTYLAVNVTSTRVQEETLDVMRLHVWCPQGGSQPTQAAFLVLNSGGRDVAVTRVTVRGQTAPWTNVYAGATEKAVTKDLSYVDLTKPQSIDIGGGNQIPITQATGALTLTSGETLIIYINNPDSVSITDVGLTVSVSIFTAQSVYYKEANVQSPTAASQASSPTPTPTPTPAPTPAPQPAEANMHVWYDASDDAVQTAFLVSNPTSQDLTISVVQVGGNPQDASNVFAYVGTFTLSSDLSYISHVAAGSSIPAGPSATLSALGSYPITLHAGQSVVIYVSNPALITYKSYFAIRVGATISPSGTFDNITPVETI